MSERTDILRRLSIVTNERITNAKSFRGQAQALIREFLAADAKYEKRLERLGDKASELGLDFDIPFGKYDFDADVSAEAFDGFIEQIEDIDFAALRAEALDLDRDEENG